MSKKWLWIGGIVTLLLFAAALYVILIPPSAPKKSAPEENMASSTKKACEVFTDTMAKDVLGAKATKNESVTTEDQTSTENVFVSNCGYDVGGEIANVLLRGAKKPEAFSTNIFGFESVRNQGIDTKKPKTVAIKNLGDQAFYNPELYEVNVLVENGQYWMVVKVGKDKVLAEKLARAVVKKL